MRSRSHFLNSAVPDNAGVFPFSPVPTRGNLSARIRRCAVTLWVAAAALCQPLAAEEQAETPGEALNVVRLLDDPFRTRVYGTHQAPDGGPGAVVIFDPSDETFLDPVTVGVRPFGMAITGDGKELLVISGGSAEIHVIDLDTLNVTEVISPPSFFIRNHPHVGNLAVGEDGHILYTDGNAHLHIYSRNTGEILETVTNVAPGETRGFGSFALSHDKSNLYAWRHSGWATPDPNNGTFLSRFQINEHNQIEHVAVNANRPVEIYGMRPDAPVLVSQDDSLVMGMRFAVEAANLESVISRFPAPVRSITPGAEIAATDNHLYFVQSGIPFHRLPESYPVQTITSDSSWLVYFDPALETLQTLNLSATVLPGGPSDSLYPGDGDITPRPQNLTWPAIHTALSYRVYSGDSEEAVAQAGPDDAAFLGISGQPGIAFDRTAPDGEIHYWRVEAVTERGIINTPVRSFRIGPVGVTRSSLNIRTVEIDENHEVSVGWVHNPQFSGPVGINDEILYQWEADSGQDWISFEFDTGTTMEALTVKLDATRVPPGRHHGEIMLTIDHEFSFTLPVTLDVDEISIKGMVSDPDSERVYALGDTPDNENAYLLEIDSSQERVTRVRPAGHRASDLALHTHEDRIYVMNSTDGHLLYFDRESLHLTRALAFARSRARGDAHRITPVREGRLVVHEFDWSRLHLIDTTTGAVLSSFGNNRGWTVSDPSGRYIYFSETGTSSARLRKYDSSGDQITQLNSIPTSSISQPRLLISEDGSRLISGSQVVSSNLEVEWSNSPRAQATTPDGSLLVAGNFIFDVATQESLYGMPAEVSHSAYNSSTATLVTVEGDRFGFYELTDETALTPPILYASSVTYQSISLEWIDRSLETGFILQRLNPSTNQWETISTAHNQNHLSRNTTSRLILSLSPESTYSFRIRAVVPHAEGPWSEVLTVTTEPLPFNPAGFQSISATGPREILIHVSMSFPHPDDTLRIERRPADSEEWDEIIHLPSTQISYLDEDVAPGTEYVYRVQRVRGDRETDYSDEHSTATPPLSQPWQPNMNIAYPENAAALRVRWYPDHGRQAETYELQYRQAGAIGWENLATTNATQTDFLHTGLTPNQFYQYRVRALNSEGASSYSNFIAGSPREVMDLIHDDFESGTNPRIWKQVQNGYAVDGGPGFDYGASLWFEPALGLAETYPVDLRNGGYLTFSIRAGNPVVDGLDYWMTSLITQQYVRVQYSVDGNTWSTIQSRLLDYPALRHWQDVAIELPEGVRTATTRIRWQTAFPGANGNWAIDNVRLISESVPNPPAPETLQANVLNASTVLLDWPLPHPQGLETPDPDNNPYRFLIERDSGNGEWTILETVPAEPSPGFLDKMAPSDHELRYRVTTLTPWTESAPTLGPEVTTQSQLREWRLANHGTPENTGGAADLAADTFGVTNLLRYAFGLDTGDYPGTFDADNDTPGLPAIWHDPMSGRLNVAFHRRISETNPEITYLVEFSQDLSEWTPQNQAAEIRQTFGNWEYVRYEAPDPEGESPNRFARVRISRP